MSKQTVLVRVYKEDYQDMMIKGVKLFLDDNPDFYHLKDKIKHPFMYKMAKKLICKEI